MISRTAISPLAAASLNTGTPAERFGRHLAICEAIEAHGFLVFASVDEVKDLMRSLKGAGPEIYQIWTKVIKRFVQTGRTHVLAPPSPLGLDEIDSCEQLSACWDQVTDVALFTDDRATQLFEVPETVMAAQANGCEIEIVKVAATPFTGTYSRFKSLGRSGVIEHDAPRETLWEGFLRPIARVSRELTFVDRFLFKNLKDLTDGNKAQGAFLSWLIERLNADANEGLKLTLIGFDTRTAHVSASAEDAAAAISQISPTDTGNLGSIQVVATQPASYLPHDRHVRSNIGVGITFLASFDTFNSTKVRSEEGVEFSYKTSPDSIEKMQISEGRYIKDRSVTRAVAFTAAGG